MYNQLVEVVWSIYQLELKMNADTKYSHKDYYFNTIMNVYNSIVKYISVTVDQTTLTEVSSTYSKLTLNYF